MASIGILANVSREDGGVYQYTKVLVDALMGQNHDNRYFLLKGKGYEDKVGIPFIENCNFTLDLFSRIKRKIFLITGIKIGRIAFRGIAKIKNNFKLIISPVISLIPYYMEIPYIITIHDLQHKYYPNFFSRKERFYRDRTYKVAARNALKIICESSWVKKDIIKYLGVDESKIEILQSPPLLDNTLADISLECLGQIKRKYDLPDEYIFYPAHLWPHKNHIKLLLAINYIRDWYNRKINLILIGGDKGNLNNIMKKIRDLQLIDQVKWLGYLPDNEIPCFYKLAKALIMPTLFESVSMPIWEAFYLGTPVLASNVCALSEQVGDAGLLFDPENEIEIGDKILQILNNGSLAKTLIERGYERIKDLNPHIYADHIKKIIESALINKYFYNEI